MMSVCCICTCKHIRKFICMHWESQMNEWWWFLRGLPFQRHWLSMFVIEESDAHLFIFLLQWVNDWDLRDEKKKIYSISRLLVKGLWAFKRFDKHFWLCRFFKNFASNKVLWENEKCVTSAFTIAYSNLCQTNRTSIHVVLLFLYYTSRSIYL